MKRQRTTEAPSLFYDPSTKLNGKLLLKSFNLINQKINQTKTQFIRRLETNTLPYEIRSVGNIVLL